MRFLSKKKVEYFTEIWACADLLLHEEVRTVFIPMTDEYSYKSPRLLGTLVAVYCHLSKKSSNVSCCIRVACQSPGTLASPPRLISQKKPSVII